MNNADTLAKIEHLQNKINQLCATTVRLAPQADQVQPAPRKEKSMTIDEALGFLKKEIKEELEEWQDRERYGKIGICHDAMTHLEAVEKFFEEVCDDNWTCTHRLGDMEVLL